METLDIKFNGKGGSYFWLIIWTSFLTIITIGIYAPWAFAAVERWKAGNTTIDGKQLAFKGTGGGFFGICLLTFLLSIITIGIYIPWGIVKIEKWKAENLYFAGPGDVEKV